MGYSSSRRLVFVAVSQAALLLAPVAVSTVGAAPNAPAAIEIRVYDQAARPQAPIVVSALQQSVTRMLKREGVNVAFVDCARPASCRDVPSPETLVLRLAPGLHPVRARQCGVASIAEGRQRGVLMTIFRGCAAATMTDLRDIAKVQGGGAFALMQLTEADIVGVFVVHELIHLVLPHETHGRGLFKATLDARDWWDVASRQPDLDGRLMTRLRQALGPDSLARRASFGAGMLQATATPSTDIIEVH